ncbi:MAG: saccharopine dehydrogenase NADP-binding domain-containing protein [Burkholderiaceae bacterium]
MPAPPLPLSTVVLGGYGNFGARICRALVDDPAITLIVAGRDAGRAAAFACELGRATPLAIDATAPDLDARLRDAGARLVIHTAGPFQGQDYEVARACARAGAHYVDLADGRRFVCDFERMLDDDFRSRGLCAITGASTVPALSSAVVDHLTEGWQRTDAIETCIAPAQSAPRGVATLAGVLSYCGGPIEVWEHGRWTTRVGWAKPSRQRFARMRPRLGACCDIPDLELFPPHYRVTESVRFDAALEVGLTQRGFALIARLRRLGLIRHPERLAMPLWRLGPWFDRLGSALGGMVIRVRGVDSHGRSREREWHIAADDDHGPEIPCMAAILLARALAHDRGPAAGARPCMGLLPLADFAPEFARWRMQTDLLEIEPSLSQAP